MNFGLVSIRPFWKIYSFLFISFPFIFVPNRSCYPNKKVFRVANSTNRMASFSCVCLCVYFHFFSQFFALLVQFWKHDDVFVSGPGPRVVRDRKRKKACVFASISTSRCISLRHQYSIPSAFLYIYGIQYRYINIYTFFFLP